MSLALCLTNRQKNRHKNIVITHIEHFHVNSSILLRIVTAEGMKHFLKPFFSASGTFSLRLDGRQHMEGCVQCVGVGVEDLECIPYKCSVCRVLGVVAVCFRLLH